MTMGSMVHDFWINDGVLLTEWSRFLLYGGLFALAMIAPRVKGPHGDSPLHALALYIHTNRYYVNQVNGFSRFFSFVHNERALRSVTRVAAASWILCIVGLGGFPVRLLCGMSVLLLATTIYGFKKLNGHRWWVASFALFFAAFSDCFGSLSIDAWIGARWVAYPDLEPDWNIMRSGFASKMILFVGAYTLVAGGIAKVRNGGVGWFRAPSFFFYIGDPKHTRLPWLVSWMERNPLAVSAMALGSVVFEIGSVVPMFLAETRPYWVVLAIGFHVGIWLLMSPKYFPQSLTYLVVISGPEIGGGVEPAAVDLSTALGAAVGVLFAVSHIGAVAWRYEGWPLTHIPMYSYDRSTFSHHALTKENLTHLVGQVGHLLKISKRTIHVPSEIEEVDRCIPRSLLRAIAYADPVKRRSSFKSSGGGGLFSTNWFLLTTPESQGADVTRDLCFYFCAETTYFRRRLMAAVMRYYGHADPRDMGEFLRLTLHLLRKVPGYESTTSLDLVVPLKGRPEAIASAWMDDDSIRSEVAAGWEVHEERTAA